MVLPKPLSNDENKKLFLEMQNGKHELREDIIMGNIILVNFVLKDRNFKDFEDYFQIGIIGLIKAVDNYDLSFNIEFSTYAITCISNRIINEIKNNIVSVGKSKRKELYLIRKYMNGVFLKTGNYPSVDDISKNLNISRQEIQILLNSLNVSYVEIENDIIEDSRQNLEDTVLNKIYIDDIMSQLPESYQRRLKQYYGIGCNPVIMEEIARRENVSRQCIQQSLDRAHKKIKEIGKVKY